MRSTMGQGKESQAANLESEKSRLVEQIAKDLEWSEKRAKNWSIGHAIVAGIVMLLAAFAVASPFIFRGGAQVQLPVVAGVLAGTGVAALNYYAIRAKGRFARALRVKFRTLLEAIRGFRVNTWEELDEVRSRYHALKEYMEREMPAGEDIEDAIAHIRSLIPTGWRPGH